jgi:hypothetical protein
MTLFLYFCIYQKNYSDSVKVMHEYIWRFKKKKHLVGYL